MKVLVTGGSGFIGTWIIRRLIERQITVRVLDIAENRQRLLQIVGPKSDQIEWLTGDVSDADVVMEAAKSCNLLIHLAAILTPACFDNPVRGIDVNLIGAVNVFEAARQHKIGKVLYMSSASVYGPDDGQLPFPTTLYGVWKLAMEGAARCYWQDHGVVSAGFRPLVVYGPGRDVGLSAGPTLACRAAARGEAYTIPFTGDTDFVYVEDVVDAFMAAVDAELIGASTYTIVGQQASVTALIAEIKSKVSDARIDCNGPLVPVAPQIDPGMLRDEFPSVRRTELTEGVDRTIDWYRNHD